MSPIELVKSVYREMKRDNAFDGAAVLAYYLTLAIFPAMIALLAVTPYLPIARVDEAIMDLMREALPTRAADMFAGVVQQVTSERRGGLLTFGLAAAYWSASNGMYAVMRQLNAAFDVKEERPFLRARATAMLLSLLFGILVLAGFSLIVLGGVIQSWIGDRFGFSDVLLDFFIVFRWVVIVLSLLLAISLTYYLAPNRSHPFRLFTAGSATATALLIVASYAFSLYTSNFGSYSNVYGSIGAMVLLMLWLYIAGLVVLAGAEVDEVLEKGTRPDDRRRS